MMVEYVTGGNDPFSVVHADLSSNPGDITMQEAGNITYAANHQAVVNQGDALFAELEADLERENGDSPNDESPWRVWFLR
jgi:hypothetical protein